MIRDQLGRVWSSKRKNSPGARPAGVRSSVGGLRSILCVSSGFLSRCPSKVDLLWTETRNHLKPRRAQHVWVSRGFSGVTQQLQTVYGAPAVAEGTRVETCTGSALCDSLLLLLLRPPAGPTELLWLCLACSMD